ncbi:hypothetical protein [Streptomyces spongiae]|uniref:hypothetical protein n=1 Tax=Streptomyces spongiae TaxID=565072 RepID=UPI0018845CF1|nr:hypothetical protein [Streptomyces spongiae]
MRSEKAPGSRPGDEADDHVAALLRTRLRAADEAIEMPAGLWESVRTATPRPRQWPRLALASALVTVVLLGGWWFVRPSGDPSPSDGGVTVTVHNAERACRELRTLECALRLAKDPYEEYAAEDNRAGRVWHGDRLAAVCVITRGTLVEDEAGVTSTRWYLVRTQKGVTGWLPGVRTRNSAHVTTCSPDRTGQPSNPTPE